jgi:hypothetical protein
MAQSRHPDRVGECPLSGVKRTSRCDRVMSACDPKRTFQSRYLPRPSGAFVHESQRFWAAHVAGLESVKLETSIFDQTLDRAVEMATTAYTFPSRS